MIQRYLDPTNDVAFKKVFSDKERLKDFLNTILRLPVGKKIDTLSFISTEEIPDLGQGKRSLFDLKVQDQAGNWFVIEMQNRWDAAYLKRIQYYGAHAYASQLKAGEPYSKLLPVIIVSVLRGTLFPQRVEVINHHKTLEEKTKQQHLFALSYVFVELAKFNKGPEALETFEDEWLYFLKYAAEVKQAPESLKDTLVKQAFETLEMFNWNEEAYDSYIRAQLLTQAEALTLEESFEKGKAKGIKEGKAKGIKEGKAQGKAEGIKEVALNLLKQGLDLDVIHQATGMPVEELSLLAKEKR